MLFQICTFKQRPTVSLVVFERMGGVADHSGGFGGGSVLVAAWTVEYRCRQRRRRRAPQIASGVPAVALLLL